MTTRSLRLAAVVLVSVISFASRPAAQDAPPAPPQQTPPTFRSGVDSISVDVIVTDKQGRAVTNLTQQDFEIREGEVIPSTRYTYYTTAAGQPKALRTWFPRDTVNGQDIIYPKRRAMELAAAAREPVIAIPDEVKETEYKTVPLVVVTPERTEKPYEQPVVVVQKAPEPAPLVVAEVRPEKQLPKTASHVPLYAALGLLSLGAAFGLRTLASRTS